MPRLRKSPTEKIKLHAKEFISYKKGMAGLATIEELADRVGASKSTMGRYMHDITKMPVGIMLRMFDVLDFDNSEKLALLDGNAKRGGTS